jgi:hypothetical protein
MSSRRRRKPKPGPEPAPRAAEDPDGLFGPSELIALRWSEALRRVALGLVAALLVARAYFAGEDAERGTGSGWVLALLLTVGIAIAAAWLGRAVRVRLSRADLGVAVLVVLIGLSLAQAADRRPAITLSWEWVALGLSYAMLRSLPRSDAELHALVGALLATACALSAAGYYQRFVEDPDTIAMYKKDPERALALAGVSDDPASRRRFENRLMQSTEPRATFALANSLAGFLVGPAVIGAAAVLGLAVGGKSRARLGPILLAAFPLAMLLSCLVLTKSRSASVGLIAGLAAVVLRHRGRAMLRKLALAGLVLVVALGAIVFVGSKARVLDRKVLTEAGKSLRYRVEYWQASWGLITESPRNFWAGVGPGNFAGPYLRHKLETSSEEIRDPHNLILEVWAVSGAPAMAALVLVLGLILWSTLGPSQPVEDPSAHERRPTGPGRGAGARWLWGCAGLGGWVVVVLLGRIDPARNPDDEARWLVLGAGWAVSALLLGPLWGRRPAEGPEVGAGFLAVVVNLLGAGGIGFPPVALMLWALGALGQDLRADRHCGRVRRIGGRWLAFGLGVVLAALIGSFVGATLPAWRSEAEMAAGRDALMGPGPPKVERAREAYRRAAEADSYSVEARMAEADLAFRAWLAEGARPGSGVWVEIDRALDDATAPPRNPNSYPPQRMRMRLLQELIRLQGPSLSPTGLAALQADLANAAAKAVALYPSDARLHAELAEAAAAIDRKADAARHAREALRLDARTPHADRKLPEAQRNRLRAALPDWSVAGAGAGGEAQPERSEATGASEPEPARR